MLLSLFYCRLFVVGFHGFFTVCSDYIAGFLWCFLSQFYCRLFVVVFHGCSRFALPTLPDFCDEFFVTVLLPVICVSFARLFSSIVLWFGFSRFLFCAYGASFSVRFSRFYGAFRCRSL